VHGLPGVRGVSIVALVAAAVLSTLAAAGDEVSRDVGRAVPEYGGAYFEESTLYIWLTDNRDSVLRRAHGELVRLGGPDYDAGSVVGLDARFTFVQLAGWFDSMQGVLGIEGAIYVDIHERSNRILVGVENRGIEPIVRAELDERGIPDDAVDIAVDDPVLADPNRSTNGWLVWAGLIAIMGIVVVGLIFWSRRGRAKAPSELAG
jgi:hypothetical protein